MVEQLLELLVSVVNAHLLKRVQLQRGTETRLLQGIVGNPTVSTVEVERFCCTSKISKPAMSRMPMKEAP